MIKRFSLKRVFLQGVYDPRINQGMWLSFATGMLYLLFFLLGKEELAIFSILAIFPSLIANIDKPGPRFCIRLLKVTALFFVVASLVLFFRHLAVPLTFIFFPLIFIFAMFAVYGNEAGRVGTGAMFVATLSLSSATSEPVYYFSLLISFGALWYGICARLWMLWWGHKILRDIVARLFAAIGDYYTLKTDLLLGHADQEKLSAVYKQQEVVYGLMNQSKEYLNRYGETRYDHELKMLKQNFLFAVDIMELLQANRHKLEEMRQFIHNADLSLPFLEMSVAVVGSLKKKSFAIRTRRFAILEQDEAIVALEEAIVVDKLTESPLVRALLLHLQALKSLMSSQQPAFERKLGAPKANEGFIATLQPHFSFSSPPLRYALRLATTMACGLLVADVFALDKSYWILLTILLVMQTGYLLTKTMISQRVIGTLAGVSLALILVQVAADGRVLLSLCLFLAFFSFCMIFFHKTLAISGVTALVVLGYQLAFGSGQDVIFVRLVDSLIGCALAFASNILLWPQWNGGGIKRLIKETLYAQEDILVLCIRALADKDIRFEQLTRRRLRLYTAQNNLLASYQQMLREPQHTREYVDSLERVLSHFVATSAHINALLLMGRESSSMPVDLVRHMELAVITMFGRCDEDDDNCSELLKDELEIINTTLGELKKTDHDPQHFAIIHLLELIYERLDAIFDRLEFCSPSDKNVAVLS
jgi:uncharacterized membrane protein YccC